MNEVLSQDEIDQLLTAISTGDIESEEVSQATDQRKIKIYDFKRPDKFSKEQIRTVSIMHETFARLTTTALSRSFGAWSMFTSPRLISLPTRSLYGPYPIPLPWV